MHTAMHNSNSCICVFALSFWVSKTYKNLTIMCGILAIFGSSLPEAELRKKLIECSQRLRHRGPDWSGYIVG